MIHSRTLVWMALAAVFVLVATGCAADSGTSGTDAVTSDTSSTTTSGHEDASDDHSDSEPAAETDTDHADDDHEDPTGTAGSDDHAEPGEGRTVTVTLTELEFSPTAFEVTAGETITFDIHNNGAIVHEFRLSNAHRIEEHIAEGHQAHGQEGGHHDDEQGDIYIELEAGASGTLTVTFPEDTTIYTEVACLIPGHYEAGMRADLAYS